MTGVSLQGLAAEESRLLGPPHQHQHPAQQDQSHPRTSTRPTPKTAAPLP